MPSKIYVLVLYLEKKGRFKFLECSLSEMRYSDSIPPSSRLYVHAVICTI